ncbi:Transcriptional adapter ada2, partial [Cladochytrium tenue]
MTSIEVQRRPTASIVTPSKLDLKHTGINQSRAYLPTPTSPARPFSRIETGLSPVCASPTKIHDASTTGFVTQVRRRNRKPQNPQRSIRSNLTEQERADMWVFQLDVYSRLREDAASLLRTNELAAAAAEAAAAAARRAAAAATSEGGRRRASERRGSRSEHTSTTDLREGGVKESGRSIATGRADRRRGSGSVAPMPAPAGPPTRQSTPRAVKGMNTAGTGSEPQRSGLRKRSTTTIDAVSEPADGDTAAAAAVSVRAGKRRRMSDVETIDRFESVRVDGSPRSGMAAGCAFETETMEVDGSDCNLSGGRASTGQVKAAEVRPTSARDKKAGRVKSMPTECGSSLSQMNESASSLVSVIGQPERRKSGGSKSTAHIVPVSTDVLKAYASTDAQGLDDGYVVTWTKNTPLHIPEGSEGYDQLAPDEVQTCSTLRLLPSMYLKIKETLLSARFHRGTFRKRDAQSWCRVDVNKTGKIFDWFLSK